MATRPGYCQCGIPLSQSHFCRYDSNRPKDPDPMPPGPWGAGG